MKQALASIIITKLHLFQVEREFFFGDAVELYKPFLGVTPKTFNAVYVNFAVGKELFMVEIDMPIAAKHERVVAPEFVGIDDTAAPHGFNRKVKESASRYVLNRLHLDDSISLQDAENRDFSCGPSAALALAPSAEVTLVHLDNSAEKFECVRGAGHDGGAYHIDRFQDRRVTDTGLLGDFSGRELQLKEFNYPEPVFMRNTEFVYPPSGEVVEGISASFASEPSTDDAIDFSTSAPCTKTTAVFPTQLCEEEPRGILGLYKGFKSF